MATMILAKKVIFNISRSFPQTQSLFLRSYSSSTHKFSRAASASASAKEKLAETGELTTVMSQNVKHKAAELKDIGCRSVADKAKQGSYKATESSVQNVKAGNTKDMAGKTEIQEANKEKQKHWMKKPPEGWHVLSTDGSARKDIAGIGGLIRDRNGSIVVAFAAGIPTAPIAVIEIKAIVEGVKIAMITKGVTKLIISDSMQAVDVINGKLKPPCEARDDIILLNSMMVFFIGFEVIHVCREANRPADFLASFCKNVSGTLVFNSGKTKNMAGKTDQEAKKEKEKHWKKPPKGWHVLSTDASDRNKDIAGIGGLIRDQKGSIVAAFTARIPTAPTHVIEMKAIVEGVKIAMITKGFFL